MGGYFGYGIGTARVEWRPFVLRRLRGAEHLRRSRLIKPHLPAGMRYVITRTIQKPQSPDGYRIGGVFGIIERDSDVGLRAEIIDFIGQSHFHDAPEARGIGEVAVVKNEAPAGFVGIGIHMINTRRVETGTAANNAMDRVALAQQEFA